VDSPAPRVEEQSLGDLLRRILNNLNLLVDQQIALVKQEIREHIADELRASKTLLIGAAIAVVGALILLNLVVMMLVLGLNEIGRWLIPYVGPWLGWFVAFVLLGVMFWMAYRIVLRGIREARISPISKTRASLEEDLEWAQRLLKSNGR
jgi:H+/Cl- antiporter ClcA